MTHQSPDLLYDATHCLSFSHVVVVVVTLVAKQVHRDNLTISVQYMCARQTQSQQGLLKLVQYYSSSSYIQLYLIFFLLHISFFIFKTIYCVYVYMYACVCALLLRLITSPDESDTTWCTVMKYLKLFNGSILFFKPSLYIATTGTLSANT